MQMLALTEHGARRWESKRLRARLFTRHARSHRPPAAAPGRAPPWAALVRDAVARLRPDRRTRAGARLTPPSTIPTTPHRGTRGCTRRDAAAEPAEDLVQRRFTAAEPDRLYVADITQHRTGQGWLYLAVVLDVFSRRVVGWAMADHLRADLVVDALQMALWQRRPAPGAIHHSDHGSQYVLGVRAPAARGRPARLDGQHRRLLRQRPG